MPGFTTSFLFPDINVWVALSHGRHVHHLVARDWFVSLEPDVRFCFCRFTQLGLLRLLTAEAVMGDEVMNQPEAWALYDTWQADDRVRFLEEPADLERRFRGRTRLKHAAPKSWADAYLAAFAETSQVTLVTFDQAFRGRVKPVILLAESTGVDGRSPRSEPPTRTARRGATLRRRSPFHSRYLSPT